MTPGPGGRAAGNARLEGAALSLAPKGRRRGVALPLQRQAVDQRHR